MSSLHHRGGIAGLASSWRMRSFKQDSDYQSEKSTEDHSGNRSVLVHKAPSVRRQDAIIQC